jgi:hypothetical protein
VIPLRFPPIDEGRTTPFATSFEHSSRHVRILGTTEHPAHAQVTRSIREEAE